VSYRGITGVVSSVFGLMLDVVRSLCTCPLLPCIGLYLLLLAMRWKCFYSDEIRIIDNCKHSSTSRAIDHTLILQFTDPRSNVPELLENLMLYYIKEYVLNGYKCSECERTKKMQQKTKQPLQKKPLQQLKFINMLSKPQN